MCWVDGKEPSGNSVVARTKRDGSVGWKNEPAGWQAHLGQLLSPDSVLLTVAYVATLVFFLFYLLALDESLDEQSTGTKTILSHVRKSYVPVELALMHWGYAI
jgi:hypothetical protein